MNSLFPNTKLFSSPTLVALAICVLVMPGCDGGDPRTATVSGRVTLDGQPVDSGSILLLSETGDSGGAELDSGGAYSLVCKPGKYLVAVMPIPVEVGQDGRPLNPMQAGRSTKIPKHYQDVGSSELAVEVNSGDNTFDVVLVSKAGK